MSVPVPLGAAEPCAESHLATSWSFGFVGDLLLRDVRAAVLDEVPRGETTEKPGGGSVSG